MPRRPVRSRRATITTAPYSIEDLNLFSIGDRAELNAAFGSLELARKRYDHLTDTGQMRRHPQCLPAEIWWWTEPGVPPELHHVPDEPDPEILADYGKPNDPWSVHDACMDTLELRRWGWLAETGRVSDESRAGLEDAARLSPNFARVVRIAEAVR